jgi:cell division protein FtsB
VSWPALRAATLAVIALAILGFGGQSLSRLWIMKLEVDRIERDISTLRTETRVISDAVTDLRTGPESIERIAREELGLARRNERVLKLPPSGGR